MFRNVHGNRAIPMRDGSAMLPPGGGMTAAGYSLYSVRSAMSAKTILSQMEENTRKMIREHVMKGDLEFDDYSFYLYSGPGVFWAIDWSHMLLIRLLHNGATGGPTQMYWWLPERLRGGGGHDGLH